MDDIGFMENYKGIVTHDCWKTYEAYENCLHSFLMPIFKRTKRYNGNNRIQVSKEIKETLLSMKNS